jgi:diacylglycerol kinase family enzyme
VRSGWIDAMRVSEGCYFTLKLAWYVLTGQHRSSPNVRYFAARQTVTIAARRQLPVQGDGEILGETPAVVELVPRAVAVIVPAPAAAT